MLDSSKSVVSPLAECPEVHIKSAAFQARYASRDIAAGAVTGLMAIPLTIGIAMMSDYPIKVGLATVVLASVVGWLFAWFRPGNYIGSPGIAAGLAPVLALGVASFGLRNMAFCVFVTALIQAVIWHFNWQRHLLRLIPAYLIEGLLAGIGLKIFLKFLSFTYELPPELSTSAVFWNEARLIIVVASVSCLSLFIYLFVKFKDSLPFIPYIVIIALGVLIAQFIHVPMLQIPDVAIEFRLPLPDVSDAQMLIYMLLFCFMLAAIDVVEQVMSNAAIEKIDPLKRKCNSNNSLLAIWAANLGSSFFGGMTNLDGLAKTTTNKLAGAYTKFSLLSIAIVVGVFMLNVHWLEYMPKFAIGCIMLFSAYKMIAGLWHVCHQGVYPLIMALLCAVSVWQLGIFEGLLLILMLHFFVHYKLNA